MTRRRPPGRLADFTGDCPRCPHPIRRGVDRVVPYRYGWIHARCASGGNE